MNAKQTKSAAKALAQDEASLANARRIRSMFADKSWKIENFTFEGVEQTIASLEACIANKRALLG